MTDKERFDSLAELAKFRLGRMYDRTKREIQMSFATWALFAAAIAYLHPRPTEWLLVAVLVIAVAAYVWFVIEVWARNRLDGSTARFYFATAEEIISSAVPTPPKRPDYETEMSLSGRPWKDLFLRDFWWSGMEIAVTLTLAVSAYLLVGNTVEAMHSAIVQPPPLTEPVVTPPTRVATTIMPANVVPKDITTPTVPAQYRGEWNENPAQCGTGLNDSELHFFADHIEFYESSGPIKAVVARGDRNIVIIAELLSGEDGKTIWDAPASYELSSDYQTLTDNTGGEKFIRHRCPTNR